MKPFTATLLATALAAAFSTGAMAQSADKTDTAPMTQLIETARDARLATERRQNASPEILAAWEKWYGEALLSVSRLQN